MFGALLPELRSIHNRCARDLRCDVYAGCNRTLHGVHGLHRRHGGVWRGVLHHPVRERHGGRHLHRLSMRQRLHPGLRRVLRASEFRRLWLGPRDTQTEPRAPTTWGRLRCSRRRNVRTRCAPMPQTQTLRKLASGVNVERHPDAEPAHDGRGMPCEGATSSLARAMHTSSSTPGGCDEVLRGVRARDGAVFAARRECTR
jgi:hypothetical protein